MTAANFTDALDFIWGSQRDGHQDDSAPGETFRTSWGVVQATWNQAVSNGIVSGNLKEATKAQCSAIYRCYYWNTLGCDLLPAGLDVLLFEQGCLAGYGTAAKILQRNVGFRGRDIDGVIGPKTQAAVAGRDIHQLINMQNKAFMKHLGGLRNYYTFQRGWTRREDAACELAHALASASQGEVE